MAAAPPRWARIVDLLCLLLILLSAVVAAFGGLRLRFGGFRLALTSPYRTLIWAAVLGVARHLLAPGAPVYRDVPSRLGALWSTTAARVSLNTLLATRLPILFVGYLAVVTFGYKDGKAPWRFVDNEFVNLQGRWDGGWYLTLAIEGYQYAADRPSDQQNIVFFPAFPMLLRTASRLMGGSSAAYVLAGTLISLAAFFGALVYLYRFARDTLRDEDEAQAAVWLLAAFPFALFFGAIYTESLFLLAALGAFDHFRRGEFGRAGAWGLLAGLTRPPGCFLSVPLALLAIEAWLPPRLVSGHAAPPSAKRGIAPALAAAAMPGIGMLIYSAYIWNLTGDPLAWAKGHAAWGREYSGLGILFAERYEWLTHTGLYAYTSQNPMDLLNVLGVLFVVAAAWPVARRLGLAYAVFILINILPPLAAGGFLSAGRFSSVLFPAFVWFGGVVPPRHRTTWIAGFMALQAFNAALFYTWRPLY